MIGLIGAMEVEITSLREAMQEKVSRTVSGVEFVSGKLDGQEVVTAVCGIGKVFAAICAEAMILTYRPDLIINTGVGGSLSSELSIGDVAIAENVVQHDMDTTPLGDAPGLISGLNQIYFPCDAENARRLAESVTAIGGKFKMGTIASGDQFIHTTEQKERIVKEFGAISCEMEGGSIGHVCRVNNVPFCVVRAISDGANDDAPMDYPSFVKMASEQSVKTVRHFLRNR